MAKDRRDGELLRRLRRRQDRRRGGGRRAGDGHAAVPRGGARARLLRAGAHHRPLLLQPHPPVADRRVGAAGQRRRNLPPLAAEAAHALLDETVLLGHPHAAAVRAPRLALHVLDWLALGDRRHLERHARHAAWHRAVAADARRGEQRVQRGVALLAVAQHMRLLQPMPSVAHLVDEG